MAESIVMSILGTHPVEYKNIRPTDEVRTIRCASEVLPNDPEGGEVKNSQYPAIKRRLPAYLIKKDITIRKPVITIQDPQGGADIFIEFTSYNQEVQTQAGVQRKIIWMDESAHRSFFDEQMPRLMKGNGHAYYTLTAAEGVNWEFEHLFERARIYIRTQAIVDRFFNRYSKKIARIETTDSKESIAVIQAATDDNPVLTPDVIEELMSLLGASDDDLMDIRRYGMFRSVSGQIFRDFDMRIHKISGEKHFPNGLPHEWLMGRFIDYHEHNPWACMFLALSPQDEVFVFKEYNPSPEKKVTLEIARDLGFMSGLEYKFTINKIDPLAAKKQSNTGMSVIDDLNRIFYELKREDICNGGYWTSWDTKSTRGRDEVRKRLKNARLVGKPFNNKIIKDGRTVNLPTLWVLDNCEQTLLSLKSWKKETWANRESLVTKDEKDKPEAKWSHFCMCLEAAFKEPAFTISRFGNAFIKDHEPIYKNYFTRRN